MDAERETLVSGKDRNRSPHDLPASRNESVLYFLAWWWLSQTEEPGTPVCSTALAIKSEPSVVL